MNAEILEYLNKPNPDFNAGFGLFCKYSVNQSLMSWIGRKHDMERLIYELKKLSVLPKFRENPAAAAHIAQYSRIPSQVIKPAKQPAVPKVNPVITFKTYDERRTKRGDLPEDLQSVYDDIVEDYKLRRGYHEKMKMAKSNKDRAQLRERLLICQRHIEEGWKKIDSYLAHAEEQKQASDDFNENTCRAYLSKMLKKEKVTSTQLATVKIRVKALMDHDCTITDSTMAAIKERGWI